MNALFNRWTSCLIAFAVVIPLQILMTIYWHRRRNANFYRELKKRKTSRNLMSVQDTQGGFKF